MKSRSAGFCKLKLKCRTKHVAAFIRLFEDAGSIPATSTNFLRQAKNWWMPQRARPSDKRGSECGATIRLFCDKQKIGGCRNERGRATSEAASAASIVDYFTTSSTARKVS